MEIYIVFSIELGELRQLSIRLSKDKAIEFLKSSREISPSKKFYMFEDVTPEIF